MAGRDAAMEWVGLGFNLNWKGSGRFILVAAHPGPLLVKDAEMGTGSSLVARKQHLRFAPGAEVGLGEA